jgi:hypothetical protein
MKNTVLLGVSGRSLQTFQENLLHSHTGDQAPEGGVSSFYQNCKFVMLHGIPSQKMVFFFTLYTFFKMFLYVFETMVCDFLLLF